ncbi:MAG: amidohydrolase family protein [Fimbriimonadales bacterium]|nr:amidohydrolase family protein [Fimbriimonadales bacterium]
MGDRSLIRPIGVVLEGRLELGVELLLEGRTIAELRPHTGVPEPFVVSPAFVNAHSHLEYRTLLGRVEGGDFWEWIQRLLPQKRRLTEEESLQGAALAARENRASGVAWLVEHSDLPVSVRAMRAAGLSGIVFQETITLREWESPEPLRDRVAGIARSHAAAAEGIPVFPSPHSPYTVDPSTLQWFGESGRPVSIHVAESVHERRWLAEGVGPMAELHQGLGHARPEAQSATQYLARLGLCRPGAQWVHCCDLDDEDVATIARGGAAVAHCPRSNRALGCPAAPIRRLREAGVAVGMGTDSAASAGVPDMFEEMRLALELSRELGEPLTAEDVWTMATTEGARSVGGPDWRIQPGSSVPLIGLNLPDARETEDLVQLGRPEAVFWISGPA